MTPQFFFRLDKGDGDDRVTVFDKAQRNDSQPGLEQGRDVRDSKDGLRQCRAIAQVAEEEAEGVERRRQVDAAGPESEARAKIDRRTVAGEAAERRRHADRPARVRADRENR